MTNTPVLATLTRKDPSPLREIVLPTPVVLIPGDGIGPEVTLAMQKVLAAVEARLTCDLVVVRENTEGLYSGQEHFVVHVVAHYGAGESFFPVQLRAVP